MARLGVTFDDISHAATAIVEAGEEPTVDRVRERLGTGSKSTIAPLLKRWRSERVREVNTEGLPEELLTAIKTLHRQVNIAADKRIASASESYQAELNALTTRLNESRTEASTLADQVEQLERKLAAAEQALEERTSNLIDTQNLLERESLKCQQADALLLEARDAVNELKQENREARAQFAHYQERSAEDRQSEREQFRTTNQQLMIQIDALRAQVASFEERGVQAAAENQDLRKHNLALEQDQIRITHQCDTLAAQVCQLTEALEVEQAQSCQLKAENIAVIEKLALAANANKASEKELLLVNQSLTRTDKELERCRQALADRTLESRELLKELAVLQGQLKQIIGARES
ncbi:DNA-binding protein [Teredinibacter turnerae]|uniref:DNA-binding protein n=1 Tax=Teredinibacter turnerae TaxID=2426 RepID=UPI000379F568|nr:DNA-binding protein [Teredinibacter turnerae]